MIHTHTQRLMQAAYSAVKARAAELPQPESFTEDYASFAKSFPALIHGVGLCQAVAYADAKADRDKNQKPSNAQARVLDDLAAILGTQSLAEAARTCSATDYMVLSRFAIEAATLLKRYAETFEKELPEPTGADS